MKCVRNKTESNEKFKKLRLTQQYTDVDLQDKYNKQIFKIKFYIQSKKPHKLINYHNVDQSKIDKKIKKYKTYWFRQGKNQRKLGN